MGFGSTEFLVFSPIKTKILPNYLNRILTTHKIHSLAISRMEGSTGRQRVPKDAFKRISIPLPSLKEQKEIVSILSEVDVKLQNEKATKAELEQLKKGLSQVLLTGKVRVKV